MARVIHILGYTTLLLMTSISVYAQPLFGVPAASSPSRSTSNRVMSPDEFQKAVKDISKRNPTNFVPAKQPPAPPPPSAPGAETTLPPPPPSLTPPVEPPPASLAPPSHALPASAAPPTSVTPAAPTSTVQPYTGFNRGTTTNSQDNAATSSGWSIKY